MIQQAYNNDILNSNLIGLKEFTLWVSASNDGWAASAIVIDLTNIKKITFSGQIGSTLILSLRDASNNIYLSATANGEWDVSTYSGLYFIHYDLRATINSSRSIDITLS